MHPKRRAKQKAEHKRIALERIKILFDEAKKRAEFAKRYIRLARKLATKYKVKMPAELKRKFCKKCNAYLRPGANCTIRTKDKKMIIKCKECQNVTRIPIE